MQDPAPPLQDGARRPGRWAAEHEAGGVERLHTQGTEIDKNRRDSDVEPGRHSSVVSVTGCRNDTTRSWRP
jgi:hypothetical protein